MNNLFFRKQLFLLLGIFTYLFAQDDDQRDYLFHRSEKTFYLPNIYKEEKRSTPIPLVKNVPGLGDLNFTLYLIADDKKGYRFIDKNGFERPEDNVNAGESATETKHRKIRYFIYENPYKKMPIAPRIPGVFYLDLYHLQFLFDNKHPEYQQITWSDFHTNTDNEKLLALNETKYKQLEEYLDKDLADTYHIQKEIERLKAQPARTILFTHGDNKPIANVGHFLVSRWENPFDLGASLERGHWGNRGIQVGNYYLSAQTGSDYEPVSRYCADVCECDHPLAMNKCKKFNYRVNPYQAPYIKSWHSTPLFEGDYHNEENVYKHELILFDDSRSPWTSLLYYLRRSTYPVSTQNMEPEKEVNYYKEALALFMDQLNYVKTRYNETCRNKPFSNEWERNRCFDMNNRLYDVVQRKINGIFQPLLNGVAAQILALEEQLAEKNKTYTVALSDFKKPEELREKAYNAQTYNYQRLELNHAKESEFQVRPGNNVNVENSSIIFARSEHSVNLLDYLHIPTKPNLPKEEGVNIDLKDEEGKRIKFELNNFKFTPSDYGSQPFTGFVQKHFDNGIFQFPLTIQMSRIFFKTGEIDVCQYEPELLDLSEYINVPFDQTMWFVSKDFVIVEKNGEKKYINLDHTEPIKDGRVHLIVSADQDNMEIPASVTVKPNIPLPAFSTDPFFVCGQPLIVKRKKAKNSGQYEYDLNDLMKGFPANSQFFWIRGEGDFVELKDGILKTPLANVQKFEIQSEYKSDWGTCTNKRIIEVDLRKAPDVPTVENQVKPGEEYMHLCNNEWPFIKFTSNLSNNNNTWRTYSQKVDYFDVEKVANYDKEVIWPKSTATYQAPDEVKNKLYAYEYDDNTKCLSRPLELIFSTDKERDLKFIVGQNQLKPGESTVVFLPENEHKDFIKKNFKYTFSYKENLTDEPKIENHALGNFFEYAFLREGFYNIRLDFDYKKKTGEGHCILNKTIENMVTVKKPETVLPPEPILAELKLRNGNIHIFVDKELVDVTVLIVPTGGGIDKKPLFFGYFEFFKDLDIVVPRHTSYLVSIFRGRSTQKKDLIFKQKIYSFGEYTDEYKKEKNINPNFKN